jgi:hypothetical protein
MYIHQGEFKNSKFNYDMHHAMALCISAAYAKQFCDKSEKVWTYLERGPRISSTTRDTVIP